MIETTDTPEDIERLLVKARDQLQAFEDAVDGKRLLARVKRASPAHPVLLARAMFLMAGLSFFVLIFLVIGAGFANKDAALLLVDLEKGIGVPGGIPVVCILLSVTMIFGFAMATMAAWSIGRESPMLPWEAKEHQKLVNEVTRLTTQKAVMERIRGTPGGARPRIATPVPMSMRGAGPTGSSGPSYGSAGAGGGGGFGGFGARPGASNSAPPSYLSEENSGGGGFGQRGGFGNSSSGYSNDGPSGGGFGSQPQASGGFGQAPSGGFGQAPSGGFGQAPSGGFGQAPSGGFGQAPSSGFGQAPSGGFGQPPSGGFGQPPSGGAFGQSSGGFGAPPAGRPQQHAPDGYDDTSPFQGSGNSGFGAPAAGGGSLLSRARAAGGAPNFSAAPHAEPDLGSGGRPTLGQSLGSSTRGGTPLGAAPRAGGGLGAPRLSAPMGFPGTPEPSRERYDEPEDSAEIMEDLSYGAPDEAPARVGVLGVRKPVAAAAPRRDDPLIALGDIVETVSAGAVVDEEPTEPARGRGLPTWGRIDEIWLEEAIEKAENMVMGFPEQARLEFSKEDDLPFTLVIERATPAMAVRAMVSYVEFLASIYTPKKARIELVKVAHLDRSFHRNVDAALQPYFAGKVRVENNPGRVDIIFSDSDPGWDAYPRLPIR